MKKWTVLKCSPWRISLRLLLFRFRLVTLEPLPQVRPDLVPYEPTDRFKVHTTNFFPVHELPALICIGISLLINMRLEVSCAAFFFLSWNILEVKENEEPAWWYFALRFFSHTPGLRLTLKGQSHEIFCTRFCPQTTPPGPIRDVLGPFLFSLLLGWVVSILKWLPGTWDTEESHQKLSVRKIFKYVCQEVSTPRYIGHPGFWLTKQSRVLTPRYLGHRGVSTLWYLGPQGTGA